MPEHTCHLCGCTQPIISLACKPLCASCAHSIINRVAEMQRQTDEANAALARAERDIAEGRGPKTRPLLPERLIVPR